MKQNGDISTTQFNKTVFHYAVVQPAILALVSFGYYAAWAGIRGDDRDDDDNLFLDILTEMIINPISAIPILSAAFASQCVYSFIEFVSVMSANPLPCNFSVF